MKFTDLFIRRPVLALVVNLVILIAGVQAYRTLNVRQYPPCPGQSENASVTVTTSLRRGERRIRARLHHDAARALDRGGRRHRLPASTSVQGVSTITARLKLNYDPIKALAEISSKVDQVRNNLPPEAQVPVINVESADSQFASAYLSFTSETLRQNEITDYLVRVVQPRLSAIAGRPAGRHPGRRTFAMRIWLKPDRLAAFNISPSQVSAALAANNHLSALGNTKGNLIQVNLTANTDLRSVEEFKNLVCASRTTRSCGSARHRRRRAGGRGLRHDVHGSPARPPCSWASSCCPTPTRSTSSAPSAPRWIRSRRTCPGRACRPSGLRRHRLHQRRDPRGLPHAG
jgi:multidrug efflux pump